MCRQRLRVFSLWASACVANWLKNRSFHGALTSPLFLVAGVVFLLGSVGVIRINTALVWRFVLVGISIAFLLEWRYAKKTHLPEMRRRKLRHAIDFPGRNNLSPLPIPKNSP